MSIDLERINFCAKVFKAFGVAFTILADHKIVYQVGNRGSVRPSRLWKGRRNRCCSIDGGRSYEKNPDGR